VWHLSFVPLSCCVSWRLITFYFLFFLSLYIDSSKFSINLYTQRPLNRQEMRVFSSHVLKWNVMIWILWALIILFCICRFISRMFFSIDSHSSGSLSFPLGSFVCVCVCDGVFEIGSCATVCSGWLWTLILLISASWVAGITGVSHWCPAVIILRLHLWYSALQLFLPWHLAFSRTFLSWLSVFFPSVLCRAPFPHSCCLHHCSASSNFWFH
jgi:hypothetical protein